MKLAFFDDHQIILEAMSQYFAQKKGVEIVGTSSYSRDFVQLLQDNEVDVAVSDVLTEEELGLGMFEEIRSLKLPVKLVVYSSIQSEFVKQFLHDYGVIAFVNKKDNLDTLWDTIEIAYLTTQYKKTRKPEITPPYLTDKEKDIVRYLAKGLSAKEIATLTNSAVNTINNQKNNLIAKFYCTNSVELVLKLTNMGYLKL
jgi:two-component system, NarL family, response regulator DesR